MFRLTGDFFVFIPKHALSLTGQIFARKILLSRIFRFFWLCSSRKEKRLRWLQRNEGRNEGREDKSYLRRSWAQSAKKSASPCLRYSCLPNDQSITQIEKIIFWVKNFDIVTMGVGISTLLKYYIEEGVSRDPKKWLRNCWTTPYYVLIMHFLTSGTQQWLAASIRVQTTRTTPPWLFHYSWSELDLARPNK